jgi:PAS domain S-box-containing protein
VVILRTGFGLIALAMLVALLGNVLIAGRFTLMAPWVFVALVVVVFSFLLHEFIGARQRMELLALQARQLKVASTRLQHSLATAAAMNARLNQSEARYKGLVDAQGDAIFRRTPDSRLTYGNEAFFKLFGLKPERAIGQPFAPELHYDSHTPTFGSFAGLEAGRSCVRYDQHVRTAYGWRWIAWEDFAVRDHRGKLLEVQSVGRDITERKALEEGITIARDKAEAGSRAKSGFLATMSHEIRTPMNGVLGMARLLLETDLRAEQRTYVEAISQSGESLLALIGEILDFSKIESGTFTLEDDEVELRQLVEGVVELSGPRAHDKDIELVAVMDADVPEAIRTDRVRLRQVLTNLVGNAVKFTEKGGVQLRAHVVEAHERHFVRFEVSDTGVGVPIGKRDEIFNEFVQADSTHARKFGGTGLGLAISRKLVEAMGGEIGIESVAGGGSQFWFTVPAVIVRPAPVAVASPLSGMRIAIVTRNPVLRVGLTEQIEAAGGRVDPADGSAILRPSIMLVDAGTGVDSNPPPEPDPAVPTIVLVTSAARTSLPQLRRMGFASYLVKPIRRSSLIEQLTQRPGTPLLQTDSNTPVSPVRGDPSRATDSRHVPQGLRILLAEDNPINALLTRELLRRRGHMVTEVTSGEAAVKVMESTSFDIVLTDIHMPGMDGIEATQAIRARETECGRRRTPIVALTADALETGMRACKDAGMDGFLTKPIEPTQLDEMLIILFPAATPVRNAAA